LWHILPYAYIYNVGDMNIYGKFGWNLFCGFREEELNREKLTDGQTDGWTLTHDKNSHGLWPGELKRRNVQTMTGKGHFYFSSTFFIMFTNNEKGSTI
jgi:hypothetical protein